jgi:hypothetical protein
MGGNPVSQKSFAFVNLCSHDAVTVRSSPPMRSAIALLFSFGLLACCASVAQETLTIDQLKFKSIFGTKVDEPDNVYSIVGSGAIRAMRTKDSDSVVSSWISNDPHAQVVKVSEMKPVMRNGTGASIFIWVIDEKESLNIFLIREGVFPAGVMRDAIDLFHNMKDSGAALPGEQPGLRRLVSDSQYKEFLKKVDDAESHAKAEKKGVWSDAYKGEREYEGIE